jgi:hypothetical protein
MAMLMAQGERKESKLTSPMAETSLAAAPPGKTTLARFFLALARSLPKGVVLPLAPLDRWCLSM